MLDQEAIENRLTEIRRRRSLLEDYIGVDYEDFAPSGPGDRAGRYYAALNHVQVALQACIDIARHVVAFNNLKTPSELKEYFSILGKKNIISQQLAERFKLATGVRNILVHSYLEVDPHRIYEIIQNDLPDFEQFVVEIGNYLEREKAGS